MNAAFPPPSRAQDMSPVSAGSGGDWSGMNNYHNPSKRPDHQYNGGYSDEVVTPPDSATFNGPPTRPFGHPGMDRSQRRNPSETGSQQSSRAASVANSRSSDGTISDQHSKRYRRMEVELQQHYTVLKNFLKGGAPQPPRPNKARDKLLRLSPVQFHELSTDVFDELQRRQAAMPIPGRPPRRDNVPPFLQPRSDFHEKRNQARQKLSSLQTGRFRDLSTDVFCELERRFPNFSVPDGRRRDSSRSVSSRGGRPPPPRVHTSNMSVASSNGFPPRNGSMPGGAPQFDNSPNRGGSPVSEFGRPMPKQFQSSTITPNKGTMVEDDEDDDYEESPRPRDNRSSDAFGLESAIASPGSDKNTSATSISFASRDVKAMQDKLTEMENLLQEKDEGIEHLRRELQEKVDAAQNLEQSLQKEIDKLQSDHSRKEKDLQSQISAAQRDSSEGNIWRTRHEQLQNDHQDLQERYEEQQKITDEVSQQGQVFLREMRAMAEAGMGGDLEREEKLQYEVRRLEEEVEEWKSRYAKVKTQRSNTRASSTAPSIRQPHVPQATSRDSFRHADGMIQDLHITRFQIAIDELLQAARTQEPTALMDYMKAVVIAVRNIALDIDNAKPTTMDEESVNKRVKLKGRVSATANNVITACKGFAASGGISPVSLLDAAASHLSAAVVDLVRMVKICPTSLDDVESEKQDNDEILDPVEGTPDPVNEAGYFNMSQRLRASSRAESEYSAISSPQPDDDDEEEEADQTTTDTLATPRLADRVNSPHGSTGLGIQAGLNLKEDDTELQELKIYLENQTDLLVQTIQALVGSIRNEEAMASVHSHISAILDIVENVLSAAEGAMEDPSWYQEVLKAKAAGIVELLTASKDKLMTAGNDPKAQVEGPSSKTFTQRLPPLAFRIARETKELVAQIEGIEAGHRGEDEDFS